MPIIGWRGNVVRFLLDPVGYMAPLRRRFGDVVPFVRGGSGPVLLQEATHGAVFAFGPECAHAVWSQMAVFHSKRVAAPAQSRAFERLSSGLFNMNDDKHRRQRSAIQPALHRARLRRLHPAMVALVERALGELRVGEPCDLAEVMMRLTMAIANKVLFGLDPTAGLTSIGEQIQRIVRLALSPGTRLPIDLPGSPRRQFLTTTAQLEHQLRTLIETRRRAPGSDDVLSALLATHHAEPDEAPPSDADTLTEDELIGQLFILFLAGHDTTKSAIVWTLLMLIQHPAVLAALRDELRGELRGDAPREDQLSRLPLLDRVIKESLRLLPPVPFVGRLTTRATALGRVELPARTEIILGLYPLHHDPELYPAPQRFRPERWESLSPSPYQYAPFGAGARMCLGAGLAMLEIKTILAMLLQRFGLELAPNPRIDRRTRIVMSSRQGLPVLVRPPGTIAPATHVRGNVREMVDLP
ncbi:MAG: cytochrome P450 [Myxococcales bacterium]|nr:cytochrome P450 [Myxococcales bacterium]